MERHPLVTEDKDIDPAIWEICKGWYHKYSKNTGKMTKEGLVDFFISVTGNISQPLSHLSPRIDHNN